MKLPEHIGLDMNCFVYYLENAADGRAAFLEREVFGQMRLGRRSAVTSALTVAELLTRPYALGQHSRAAELRSSLEALPRLRIKALDSHVGDQTARIRGETGLRLADATQIATALLDGAGAFLTNDRRAGKANLPIEVLVLDSLLDGSP